jgi:predicted PurR-regulated permease PerM
MLGMDARLARNTWTIILVLLFVGFLYKVRASLFIFVVALLFAYLLWPLVRFLDQRLPGRSKLPSLTIVYLLLISVMVAVGLALGSRIAFQANDLAVRIPELLSRFDEPIFPGAKQSSGLRIINEIQHQIALHAQEYIEPVSTAVMDVVSHVQMILFIILVPILSFFFLKDGRKLLTAFLDAFVDIRHRRIFDDIAEDLHVLLARYMRALVLLGLCTSVAYALFFWLIGVPYGLLLGAIAFFFEFVPLIGPLTASVIILLVAGLSGFGHLFWIVGFMAGYRLFQDYVLSPQLLSNGIRLHPLLIIFGALAGAQLAGIPGAFLSVPVIATLRIIYRQTRKRNLANAPSPVA